MITLKSMNKRKSRGSAKAGKASLIFFFLTLGLAAKAAPLRASEIYRVVGSWSGPVSEPGRFHAPMGLAAAADGSVFIADSGNKRVWRLDESGRGIGRIGKPGSGPGEFKKPVAAAIAPDGNLYVADFDLDRIEVFSPKGRYLFDWGSAGSGPGQFNSPAGLAIDAQGEVYVADFYNGRVEEFDPNGKWLRNIGRKGRGTGEFYYPTDIAFFADGRLLIADAYNNRLQIFNSEAKPIAAWGFRWKYLLGLNSALRVPSGVAINARGETIVADSANHRIVLLSPEGDFQGELKLTIKNSSSYSPEKIAIGRDGRVFVADTADDKILVLKKSASEQTPKEAALAGKIIVTVEGLACPFCVYGLEKHLESIHGVAGAQINLGSGTAIITIKPGMKIRARQIRKAVRQAGFKASEIKNTKEEKQ